jgi:REP element-mobilizing transposase RayT
MAKQIPLFALDNSSSRHGFGGTLIGGQRKSQRPLSSREALHLVLRADVVKGPSLLRHRREVEGRIEKYAHTFGLRIYKLAVCKDHIHFLLRLTNRRLYRAFVRALTGQLSLRLKIKWQLRPWSRVVKWGRAFEGAKNYVFRNILEAAGVIPYKTRRRRIRKTQFSTPQLRKFARPYPEA